MLGYCSNSPLRCANARSMIMLNQVDQCCSECRLYLLPAQQQRDGSHVDQRVLQLALLVMVLIVLALVYIYYTGLA
ncbi:hypothetical protein RCH20_001293 [Psychrobacter sp. PL15]|nr:hypothetical protein [Psychrobacter sp. PL15]